MRKIRIYFKKIQLVIKRYIMGNWGLSLIAAFLMLLFASAVLLAIGQAAVAETTANVAYFTLAIGVVLQLVCFGKNRSKNGVLFNGSS